MTLIYKLVLTSIVAMMFMIVAITPNVFYRLMESLLTR